MKFVSVVLILMSFQILALDQLSSWDVCSRKISCKNIYGVNVGTISCAVYGGDGANRVEADSRPCTSTYNPETKEITCTGYTKEVDHADRVVWSWVTVKDSCY